MNNFPSEDFWKRKLAAFLHDTPTKCLNIPEHQEKSRAAMLRAGFSEDDIGKYDHAADWSAAAADRYPFPSSRASGLTCAFDGERNGFHHPLCGSEQLKFPPFKSDSFGTEVEQFGQPSLDHTPDSNANFWRDQFFAHWRLWCRNAREKDFRLAFLPADTRIPDHTIWNHMQVVSALAGANYDGGPAFLRLQIGGVQEFIAQARNTRDLWSGSYLLSWLMAAGLKKLSQQVGADAVIFPSLLGQPLFDLHWKNEIWEALYANASSNENTVWSGSEAHESFGLKATTEAQLTPSFPNVFLAMVPANLADRLGSLVSEAIQAELRTIAACVFNDAKGAGILTDDDRTKFHSQITRFLRISWHAEPWPGDLDNSMALAKNAPSRSPLADAAIRIEAVRTMAEVDLPLEHRDLRNYERDPANPSKFKVDSSGRMRLNNRGLAWSVLVAYQQTQLDSVRQTHAFTPAAEGGWTVGSNNTKDALIGRDEALTGGAELARRCQIAGGDWAILFKKPDPISALTLLKRTWHRSYLHAVWEFQMEAFRMPNTRGIAAHEPSSNLDDEEDPSDVPSSEKYFAILALDGDEIGKWISGAKTPYIKDQLAHYSDGSGNLTQGSLCYFERLYGKSNDPSGFLASQRVLSPSYHLQFSEALSNFALYCVPKIVKSFDGRLIYAGGDDVLALVPADSALSCARALRAAFKGSHELSEILADLPGENTFTHPAPGFLGLSDYRDEHSRARSQGTPIPFIVPGKKAEVSVGIAIAHFKAPLQDVVRAAQIAEKQAKSALGRAAVSLRVMKRSGEILDWGTKWESGGLALFEAITFAMKNDGLSSKFPHRLCEIFGAFVSDTSIMPDLREFDISQIFRSEFIRLLNQHRGPKWKDEMKGPLIATLGIYLDGLRTRFNPETCPQKFVSEAARDFIGLSTAAAFAHRTG